MTNGFAPVTVLHSDGEFKRRSDCWLPFLTHALAAVLGGLAVVFMVSFLGGSIFEPRYIVTGEPLSRELAPMAFNPYAPLPSKYVVDHPIPVKNQWFRGTCWDFATTALLEHHYRVQGVRRGLLKPHEYVQFSEQAFGEIIVDLCAKHHDKCVRFGDIAYGSTNGGDAGVLAVFSKSLSNAIVPVKVCPYTPMQSGEWECDGLKDALAHNPIHMTVKSFETFYDVEAIKRALVEADGYSMTLSVPWFNTALWLPCEGPTAKDPQCQPKPDDSCQHYCPTGFNYNERCCKKVTMPMYNGDGEFYENHAMDLIGGHLMLIVGYTDTYMTEYNDVGGFIVRNSWGPTGSHSIKYWKREISEADELEYCPNHQNPRFWAVCSVEDMAGDPNFCMSKKFREQQAVAKLAVDLKCVDADVCHIEDNYSYVALNTTWERTTLKTMCFSEYKDEKHTGHQFCTMPVPGGNLVKHTPTIPMLGVMQAKYPRDNHPDVCGHYFFPYSLLTKTMQRFGGVYANRIGIEFSDDSYPSETNKADPSYALLHESTALQMIPSYPSSYPDASMDPAEGV